VGMEIRVATPEEYVPRTGVVDRARSIARSTGGRVLVGTDPTWAVAGADVIYTDVWASMGQEHEREARLRIFQPYQVNAELVALASPEVMVMHCLPAHRGEEITGEVNKLHMHKAILVSLMLAEEQWPTDTREEIAN
jgi:ornithine carbamoyltransferase